MWPGSSSSISTFVLIISGAMALHRALHGRWSVLPLIAFPLLYNRVFLIGVTNYQFGIGIALWGLATWVALREKALPLRLFVSTLFVLVLFFCHLFAVGVYAVGLLAFELWRLTALERRDWQTRAPRFFRDRSALPTGLAAVEPEPDPRGISRASNGIRPARSTGSPSPSRSIPTSSPSSSRAR